MEPKRPTKKQHELLSFIDGFIKGNGYGPSYREIMRALDYKSVSTVATHVDGLIARGWLRKRDKSARSLEVASLQSRLALPVPTPTAIPDHLAWLEAQVARSSDAAERASLQAALAILESRATSTDETPVYTDEKIR